MFRRKLHSSSKSLIKYPIRSNFLRSASFYSNLTLDTLYHGITCYNRRRYKRRKNQKKLLSLLNKKIKLEFENRSTAFLASPRYSKKSGGGSTRLLNDLQILRNLNYIPFFTVNYLFIKTQLSGHSASIVNRYQRFLRPLEQELRTTYLTPYTSMFNFSNLTPYNKTRQIISRKLLKLFKFHKFTPGVTMWYSQFLINFLENCSGKQVLFKFNPFLENYVNFFDLARCAVWFQRVRGFKRILGPKIFIHESLKILCLAFRYKDPTFLSNWMRGMLYRMSF